MTPVWWFPIAGMMLNLLSAGMFLWHGNYVGCIYWLCAFGLTACVMVGLAK